MKLEGVHTRSTLSLNHMVSRQETQTGRTQGVKLKGDETVRHMQFVKEVCSLYYVRKYNSVRRLPAATPRSGLSSRRATTLDRTDVCATVQHKSRASAFTLQDGPVGPVPSHRTVIAPSRISLEPVTRAARAHNSRARRSAPRASLEAPLSAEPRAARHADGAAGGHGAPRRRPRGARLERDLVGDGLARGDQQVGHAAAGGRRRRASSASGCCC